jgi:hypothetical protein
MNQYKTFSRSREDMIEKRKAFRKLFRQSPIAEEDILDNLGLFIPRQTWARYLFLHELYKKIIGVHGHVLEFGNRWGQNLALFSSFRGIYEPHNLSRKIVGFDTFSGFPDLHEKDGDNPNMEKGGYAVEEGYEETLEAILDYHESESPISHIRKFELVKGDVMKTLDPYLEKHPETIIALAYFDLDLYEPTRHCLESLKPYLTKGSILGFDELCYEHMPGETTALREVLGLKNIRIERFPFLSPKASFVVIE